LEAVEKENELLKKEISDSENKKEKRKII